MSTHHTESVWEYPRPPAVDPDAREVVIEHAGTILVRTSAAVRVLETSHPPTFYLPLVDVAPGALVPSRRRTVCEFKGVATYFDVVVGSHRVRDAAWTYADPSPGYEAIRGHVAFYPGRFDRATVGGEVVRAQDGDFYGGWITSEIEGPFKGGPGTFGW